MRDIAKAFVGNDDKSLHSLASSFCYLMWLCVSCFSFYGCFRSALWFSLLVCLWTSYARSYVTSLLLLVVGCLNLLGSSCWGRRLCLLFVCWRLACCMWFVSPKHRQLYVQFRTHFLVVSCHIRFYMGKVESCKLLSPRLLCLMLLVVLQNIKPRWAFVGAPVFEFVSLFSDFVNVFASLPDVCHVMFVQLCVV